MAEQIRESGRWLNRWGNQGEVNQGDVGGRLFTLAPIRDLICLVHFHTYKKGTSNPEKDTESEINAV